MQKTSLITLIIALIMSVGTVNVQAQYRYNPQPEKLDNLIGIGAAIDGQGSTGINGYFDEWMLEVMFQSDYQGSTTTDYNNYKIGRAFPLVRTSSTNFSLYGMGGYASYEEDSGSSEDKTSGMIFEVGGLLGFKSDRSWCRLRCVG